MRGRPVLAPGTPAERLRAGRPSGTNALGHPGRGRRRQGYSNSLSHPRGCGSALPAPAPPLVHWGNVLAACWRAGLKRGLARGWCPSSRTWFTTDTFCHWRQGAANCRGCTCAGHAPDGLAEGPTTAAPAPPAGVCGPWVGSLLHADSGARGPRGFAPARGALCHVVLSRWILN